MSSKCLPADAEKSLVPPASIAIPDDGVRLVPASQRLPLAWRAHDRTHLELPVPVPVDDGERGANITWEAYFFVPESFRLNRVGYGKEALDADFKSYVRLAVPETQVRALDASLDRAAEMLNGASPSEAVDILRLFGCRMHRVLAAEVDRLEGRTAVPDEMALSLAFGVNQALARFRAAAMPLDDGGQGELAVAARWVDEHMSLNAEAMLVRLGHMVDGDVRETIEGQAVNEARYRRDVGYPAVLDRGADLDPLSRDMERLEFRRHTLKRFTSSVLWLSAEAQDPSRWAKHVLHALAASFAMAFAVAAALWNGVPQAGELGIWLLVAVLAYAVKDRIKASLQDVFSGVLSKRFPDRRWQVRGRDEEVIGTMDERSGFSAFDQLSDEVLAARRMTRQHPIEEEARPETVLWHQKTIGVEPGSLPEGYAGLLEIFRVDLRRWLVHTDEPNSRLLVADPESGCIDSVVAPRVYNIAVVYRLQHEGDPSETWHRARVVVTRKGIRRIERIN